LQGLRAKKKINTPILMLTARDSGQRIEYGDFDSGADDYVVKPFAFSELLARIRALLTQKRVIVKNSENTGWPI